MSIVHITAQTIFAELNIMDCSKSQSTMAYGVQYERKKKVFLERTSLSHLSTMSLLILVFFLYFPLLLRIFCQNSDFYRSIGLYFYFNVFIIKLC